MKVNVKNMKRLFLLLSIILLTQTFKI